MWCCTTILTSGGMPTNKDNRIPTWSNIEGVLSTRKNGNDDGQADNGAELPRLSPSKESATAINGQG